MSKLLLAGSKIEVVGSGRRLDWDGVLQIRESQNTQSPRLRFRALLTEGGDQRLQLHRV
jgi:hypothetical protein